MPQGQPWPGPRAEQGHVEERGVNWRSCSSWLQLGPERVQALLCVSGDIVSSWGTWVVEGFAGKAGLAEGKHLYGRAAGWATVTQPPDDGRLEKPISRSRRTE